MTWSVTEPISQEWSAGICQTAPGCAMLFLSSSLKKKKKIMGYVALFHVPVTEMHLHKVLMCFEGRGGVVN